jgi:hypothetical protein
VVFWACVDLNLETLKDEILGYLESSDFAVFRGHSGGLETMKLITWDSDRFPDYRPFLDTARKAGEKLIMFATREVTDEEIEEAMEDLEGAGYERDEYRALEKRIRAAERHKGETCALELAFSHGHNTFVYEARQDWFEDFLDACEEVSIIFPGGELGDDSESDGLGGGYYSKN